MIAYLIAGIALVGALVGGYMKVHGDGLKQGRAEVQNVWDAENRKAQAAADATRAAREAEARTHAARYDAANAAAADYHALWLQAKARNTQPLATCGLVNAVAGERDGAGHAPDRVSVTAQFVRLYDAAWSGRDGKPVFSYSGEPSDPAGGTATVEEVLTNHGENAARCSDNSRRYSALIALINQLRAQ